MLLGTRKNDRESFLGPKYSRLPKIILIKSISNNLLLFFAILIDLKFCAACIDVIRRERSDFSKIQCAVPFPVAGLLTPSFWKTPLFTIHENLLLFFSVKKTLGAIFYYYKRTTTIAPKVCISERWITSVRSITFRLLADGRWFH